ncbi:uncharacterized protein BP01DRAFT_359276 [Aspergillus saccharolyticus JOP 1030-1]|uniref:Uncharacterized protein n=1 Tax=Aspergillus saccharolyticus JOP 1030-1 TaxID=1450539 RepID=A0A318ZD65_9EURO|nr:hypothetical protein BP01DRAFT_359276 [Aspergillus saccharolyticus JOP 1030-1]PYH42593.1 hypothetical protein BP01DRAFT_359276 [Aspergillus saccharolyticus JOP 1030-1]
MPIYLISKAADPLFAFAIGTSAALLRIQREQREKFPERAEDISIGSVLQLGTSRVQRWWAGEFAAL